jgi:hypothetical protein
MVQLFADDAPTHINTALGFILLGIRDLSQVLRRRWFGVAAAGAVLKVVLLTGWGHRMAEENEKPANVDRVLGKPPKMIILRAVLAELTHAALT